VSAAVQEQMRQEGMEVYIISDYRKPREKRTIVRPNFEISRASPAAIASMALVKPAVGAIPRLPLPF